MKIFNILRSVLSNSALNENYKREEEKPHQVVCIRTPVDVIVFVTALC